MIGWLILGAAAFSVTTPEPLVAGSGIDVRVERAAENPSVRQPQSDTYVVLRDDRSGEILQRRTPSKMSAQVRIPTPGWLRRATLELYVDGERQAQIQNLRFVPSETGGKSHVAEESPPGTSNDLDTLAGAALANRKFRRADFRGRDLARADLSRADLRGARLGDADLTSASLVGANLEGADLSNAQLEGADLERARLAVAELEGANLRSANLRFADLSDANLANADLLSARLEGANLSGTEFTNARCPDGSRAEPRCSRESLVP